MNIPPKFQRFLARHVDEIYYDYISLCHRGTDGIGCSFQTSTYSPTSKPEINEVIRRIERGVFFHCPMCGQFVTYNKPVFADFSYVYKVRCRGNGISYGMRDVAVGVFGAHVGEGDPDPEPAKNMTVNAVGNIAVYYETCGELLRRYFSNRGDAVEMITRWKKELTSENPAS